MDRIPRNGALFHPFFLKYRQGEELADPLFSLLFDEDHDDADSQMGAAQVLAGMDRRLFRKTGRSCLWQAKPLHLDCWPVRFCYLPDKLEFSDSAILLVE